MIVFENEGEVDVRALHTFGVSAKESENPIGFFGTGFKYAVAILLRNKCEILVYSGTDVITFFTTRDKIRDKSFDFVMMSVNGEEAFPAGFTTEHGKTWELWMAYRELACNCKDEGGETRETSESPKPESGKTKVIVIGSKFSSVHSRRGEYMLESTPILSMGGMSVHDLPSTHYFYRGIRVQLLMHKYLFTYDDHNQLDLTEDRTAKDPWTCQYRIARAWMVTTDKEKLREVLTAENVGESQLDFVGWGKPSNEFLELVGELVRDRVAKINQTAIKAWEQYSGQCAEPKDAEINPIMQISLDKAKAFVTKLGFKLSQYEIKISESLGSGTLGMARNNKIYVSERAFQLGGAKQVASVLIEEFAHLKYAYGDCSREMQNWLFDKLVSMGEQLNGEPL
jgi:hypothetical protein